MEAARPACARLFLLGLGTAIALAGGCAPSDCPEGPAEFRYRDSDGDGHGLSSERQEVCADAEGWVERGDDCDDVSPSIHPDADETCNGVDDD